MENTKATTELNQEKLNYLISLGVEIQDYNLETTSHYPAYVSYTNDYDYTIEFDDFNIGDTLSEIEQYSEMYSCCGDILDKDYMICPSCKEHC
jgi:hypothetical protein